MLRSIERRGRNRIGEAAAVTFKAGKPPPRVNRSFPGFTAIGDTIRTRSGVEVFRIFTPTVNV
ncbi:hypothetical protein [Paenibacillus glucanolyticus]|uniref:hypothetical protein n=1 Tax=Paenibacillus glucanolyticus TaxID=59843 RepID=UPI00128C1DE3|nr:hypothetical protein [Paenibacillus glucanolyticus]